MSPIQWKSASSPDAIQAPSNIWFAVSLGLLGIIIGFAIGSWHQSPSVAQVPSAPTPSAQQPTPSAPSGPLVPVDFSKDHYRGSTSATVAVVEYSDFECPFSKRVFSTYQQIMQQYGGKVVQIYRHYPLSFHQNAEKEAEASECVAELGGNDAFWKFHDGIFEQTTSNGTGFALDQLPVLAAKVGVDKTKFQQCLDSGKYAQKVQQEENEGTAAGVQGTPGNFVVNLKTKKSVAIDGAVPFSQFQTSIDAQLK